MIHRDIRSERHSLACSHGSSSLTSVLGSTDVAAQVVGFEVGDWGVVVCVLADVLVDAGLDAVGGQLLEDVVAVDGRGQSGGCDEGGGGLHDEMMLS